MTLIYAGAYKVDGNPYSQLPGDVRDEFQLSINSTREQFAQKSSDYTVWAEKIQGAGHTEAAAFIGADAIKSGLADQLVNYADAIAVMADALKPKMERFMSGTETTAETTTQNKPRPRLLSRRLSLTRSRFARTPHQGELARVMAIINCPEVAGREAQAKRSASLG